MRRNGWQGVRRQKTVRTTIADPTATRPPDLVDRQFGVGAPKSAAGCRLHLRQADQRGVRLRRVRHQRLRWRHHRVGSLRFQAHPLRRIGDPSGRGAAVAPSAIRPGTLFTTRDAGSQYTSVRFGETLSLSGLRPSVGGVGDAYDNALAETTIGLYKTECIRADSPFRRGPLNNLVRCRVHHRRLRRLVQPAAPHAPPRTSPTRRSRGPVLFPTRDRPTGRPTEPRGCMKPGMVQTTPMSDDVAMTPETPQSTSEPVTPEAPACTSEPVTPETRPELTEWARPRKPTPARRLKIGLAPLLGGSKCPGRVCRR